MTITTHLLALATNFIALYTFFFFKEQNSLLNQQIVYLNKNQELLTNQINDIVILNKTLILQNKILIESKTLSISPLLTTDTSYLNYNIILIVTGITLTIALMGFGYYQFQNSGTFKALRDLDEGIGHISTVVKKQTENFSNVNISESLKQSASDSLDVVSKTTSEALSLVTTRSIDAFNCVEKTTNSLLFPEKVIIKSEIFSNQLQYIRPPEIGTNEFLACVQKGFTINKIEPNFMPLELLKEPDLKILPDLTNSSISLSNIIESGNSLIVNNSLINISEATSIVLSTEDVVNSLKDFFIF